MIYLCIAGALGSYRSKFVMDYEFGQNRIEEPEPPTHRKPEPERKEDHLKPSEEDLTFSDSKNSDMLF